MQKRVRFDVAELSGEVVVTPMSDSRHTVASYPGRACAKAYRGEGECSGGFGAEDRPLVGPAVSSGAFPVMALRRNDYGGGARERRKKRGAGRGQNGVAWGC